MFHSLLKKGSFPSLIIFEMNSCRSSKNLSKQVHSPKSTQLMFEHLPQQLDFIPISPCISALLVLSLNLNRRELHFSQKETLVMSKMKASIGIIAS